MGLGQLRGPSCWPGAPRGCPNQISIVIVAHDGSYVNGFRSAVVVMRNPRGPRRDETKSQTGHGAESHPCAKNAQGWGTRHRLLHRDRDFHAFEKVLGLEVVHA